MRIISTPHAPAAIGPYSQATIHGDTVYCSGQIGLKPDGSWAAGGAVGQTQQVLDNLDAVLHAANTTRTHVLRATIFLASMDDFKAVNEVYAAFFGEHRPARQCVEVPRLPKDARVEISFIAAIP